MNVESLRKRLEELDKEYARNQEQIVQHTNEIKKLEIRQNQLNGAYQEITKLISELTKSENQEIE